MANDIFNNINNNESGPLNRSRRNNSGDDDSTSSRESAFKKFSAAVDKFATYVSGTTGKPGEQNVPSPVAEKLNGMFSRMGDFGEMFQDMSESLDETSSSSSGTMVALQVVNKVLEAIRSTLGFINDTVQKGIDSSIANQKQYL